MALSLIWMDLGKRDRSRDTAREVQQEVSEILVKLGETGDNRREIFGLVEELPGHGEAGKEALLSLAEDPNAHTREFALMFLGEMGAEEAEDIMIRSLQDSVKRVRSSAILAVGQIGSIRAADSLVAMLIHPVQSNNLFHIYGSLGAIGDPGAIPVLAEGLKSGEHYNQIAALNAIMDIDPEEGISHAMAELQDEHVEVRRNAVIVCILSGDPQAGQALRSVFDDEDFEVRFYAKQGVRRLEN